MTTPITDPVAAIPSFAPEKVDVYEAGFKFQTPDRLLTLNAAAFYTEYKDMQVQVFTSVAPVFRNAGSASMSIGRGAGASLALNDPRVSRMHATLEWRGGQFVLSDASSYGTWVYFGNQNEAVVLRRTECYLVGHGLIALGCDRNAEDAPLATFAVKA
mgnify:CR=1 FL=1